MAIAAIVGYLLGSIPVAVLVGRIAGVDPRTRGDGNPGWWNMRGLVGHRLALLVLFGDMAKGFLAGVAGDLPWGDWWWPFVGVGFAMLGHAFPVFAGFRGGRSVLTFVGGMLAISPMAVVLAAAAGLLLALTTRRRLWGLRCAVFAIPVAQAFFEPRAHVAVTGILMAFIGLRFLLAGRSVLSNAGRAAGSPG